MNRVTLVILAGVLFGGSAVAAGSKIDYAFKVTKVSASSTVVSCNDDSAPAVAHLEGTTAIVITCKK
jgi:hypothetical protein